MLAARRDFSAAAQHSRLGRFALVCAARGCPRCETGGLLCGRSLVARLKVMYPRCETEGLFSICLF